MRSGIASFSAYTAVREVVLYERRRYQHFAPMWWLNDFMSLDVTCSTDMCPSLGARCKSLGRDADHSRPDATNGVITPLMSQVSVVRSQLPNLMS